MRLWNVILFNPTGLDLVSGTGQTAKVLQTATTANFSSTYDTLPPGRYTFTVYRAGDRQTPLKTFDVPLVDHGYFTILAVQLPGGQLSIELLNDTPDPLKPPVNRITVRQLGLNTHAVVVTAQNLHTDPLEPGSMQVLDGLPDGTLSVGARSTAGSNQKNWNMDVDFRTARHQTICHHRGWIQPFATAECRHRPITGGTSGNCQISPAMIARKAFLRGLLGSALAVAGVLLAPNSVQARRKKKDDASPSPTPEPSPSASPESRPDTAKLRLWKSSDASDVPVTLRFLMNGKPAAAIPKELEGQPGNYQFTSYTEISAGPQMVEIGAADRNTVRLSVYPAINSQSTLLIRLRGSELLADWIDDTPDPADSGCEFNAYNLLFGNSDVQLDFGTLMTVHLASGRSSVRLSGIKRGMYSVTTSGTDSTGKSIHWTTEIDFRQSRKLALLIFPDSYGRIRPRVNPV